MAAVTHICDLMHGLCEPVGARYAVERVRSADEFATLARDVEKHLSDAEQRRGATFKAFKRRAEFCAGRIAAKRALAQVLPCISDPRLEIECDALGAPRPRAMGPNPPRTQINSSAENGPVKSIASRAHLSISHSNGYAVAVAAPWRIGVDLEAIETRPNALVRYFYCAAEQRALQELQGSTFQEAIHRFWTRKESACKWTGWGARLDLREIDASQPQTRIGEHLVEWRSAVLAGFAASIAFTNSAYVAMPTKTKPTVQEVIRKYG